MGSLFSTSPNEATAPPAGAVAIGASLAILIAVALCPSLPAVTGMALVALGATSVTLARFRGTAAIVPVILLHLVAYGALYTLFVGATLPASRGHFRPPTITAARS